jgi:hypothetical protein
MKQNMGRTLCKTYGIKTRCIGNTLGEHIGNLGSILGTWWEPIGNLKGTCWEQRKTTSDSALKISGFRVSPDFSADAAWQILRMMLKAELPGWKMHNWWWGGWWEREWDLGWRTHERGREIGSISDSWKGLGFGVYLPSPIFYNGQLYVAISRVTSNANIKIFSGQGPDEYMRNVVYREVLEM